MTKSEIKSSSRKWWATFSLKSLLVLTALSAIFVTWRVYQFEHGTVNQWIDSVLAHNEIKPLGVEGITQNDALVGCQIDISTSQQIKLLMKSLNWLPTPERRNCVLKIFAEQFPDKAHDLFVQIAEDSKHELLTRNAILLASLFRIESDIIRFNKFLEDDSPEVRSAAIDAIGVIHAPSFSMPVGLDNMANSIIFDSDPRINLKYLKDHLKPPVNPGRSWGGDQFAWKDASNRILVNPIKDKIKSLLTNDPSPQVRSAAARAARNWNPENYRLRVAEWGVWINEDENLTLAQSIIDEIPPFVHRVGNDMASITNGRTNSIIVVTKPIIHFEVNAPMVVDVSVRIRAGRPWFGFPMPDDFATTGTTGQMGTPKNLPRDIPKELNLVELTQIGEGYPWLIPGHTKNYANTLTDVGFRWQTLLALPEKADWMNLEPVSDDKYAWWNRLRQVPASWISNRQDSERFLYYDGPTEHPSPVSATLNNDQLTVSVPNEYYFRESLPRTHLFMQVKDGALSAHRFDHEFQISTRNIKIPVADTPIKGENVEKVLLAVLIAKGLNTKEAQGLIDCWRPQFFETEGQRLLTLFDKVEYETLCPLSVSPTPTELARVGIVLTEFGVPKE